MDIQAVTGQLYVVAGEIREVDEVPGLLAQSPPAKAIRGRARDSLFVHLSLTGRPDQTETLAQDLLEAISQRFYATPGSVTAALRTAILEANQLLLRLNMSGTGVVREGAIMCAVLRGQELFVVQTGEAFALIGRNFGVERLPAREPERITPMGRTAGLDLRYYHNWLEPGDMLLLADPRLAHVPSETLIPVLVDSTVEDSIPELAELLENDTGCLLLVEFTDEPPLDLPDTVAVQPPAAATQSSARPSLPPAPAPRRVRTAPEKQRLPAVSLPEFDLPTAMDVETTARRATSQTARGLSRATGWLADLMRRLRPAPSSPADRGESEGWALPALLAIVIPLLVAVIVGGVYIQRGRVRRVSEIRQEMQQSLVQGSEAASKEDSRTAYNLVLKLAAEAEALRPGDDAVNRMRSEALAELDRIDDVTRLAGRSLHRYEEGSQITGVVLREGLNGDIYVLDSGNNRVLVHDTEEDYLTLIGEGPEEILFGGQAVGTQVVGNIVDIMWRGRGAQISNDGLAMLDGRGVLVSYYPSFANVRAVPLGLSSEWVRPVALAQFNERVYVLDAGAQRIWRYFAESDGFLVDESQRALTLPDLAQAVDVAIYSEDGSVVILYGDGRLRRYGKDSLLWDEASLYESGLASPLVSPTRLKIIGRGLNSSIFVADPGSGRIVQVSLGGTFLAQYKASDAETGDELFTKLGDFDVAEAPLRIFVGAENGLFVATQP